MRLTKPLLVALAAALMLQACSIFKPPQAVPLQLPPQPVPVAALALCPPPPALLSAEMDALAELGFDGATGPAVREVT